VVEGESGQGEADPREVRRAWLRALAATAPYANGGGASLPDLIAQAAARFADRPALLADGMVLSHRALAARIAGYGGWARRAGIRPGEAVAMPSSDGSSDRLG